MAREPHERDECECEIFKVRVAAPKDDGERSDGERPENQLLSQAGVDRKALQISCGFLKEDRWFPSVREHRGHPIIPRC